MPNRSNKRLATNVTMTKRDGFFGHLAFFDIIPFCARCRAPLAATELPPSGVAVFFILPIRGHTTSTQEVYEDEEGESTGIITWIIVGLIAGALGKLIMPGDDPGGIIVTILLGMVGAIVGGFIVQGLLGLGGGGFIWSILVTTLGAIILLAIYRMVVGQRRT